MACNNDWSRGTKVTQAGAWGSGQEEMAPAHTELIFPPSNQGKVYLASCKKSLHMLLVAWLIKIYSSLGRKRRPIFTVCRKTSVS